MYVLVICDTVRIFEFITYTEANNECDHDDIPYFTEGHTVYIDNGYFSPILAEIFIRY